MAYESLFFPPRRACDRKSTRFSAKMRPQSCGKTDFHPTRGEKRKKKNAFIPINLSISVDEKRLITARTECRRASPVRSYTTSCVCHVVPSISVLATEGKSDCSKDSIGRWLISLEKANICCVIGINRFFLHNKEPLFPREKKVRFIECGKNKSTFFGCPCCILFLSVNGTRFAIAPFNFSAAAVFSFSPRK